jgi:protein SCO1/2
VPSRTAHPSLQPLPLTTESRRGRAALGVAAAVVVAAVGGWFALRPRPLPVLGTVPSFALIDQTGARLASDDLAGGVWVANFVFTRCPDVCPALTARMAQLQGRLGPAADRVRLVSFSVDPNHDTPEVLRDYARRAGARDGWRFATGPRADVAALLRDGFRVAFADDGPPTAPITHSDRFVLVDPTLAIRGYYHGSNEADLERLAHDARALAREAS